MARNKRFKVVYTITVDGTTTNDFMVEFVDAVMSANTKALDSQFAQTHASMESKRII